MCLLKSSVRKEPILLGEGTSLGTWSDGGGVTGDLWNINKVTGKQLWAGRMEALENWSGLRYATLLMYTIVIIMTIPIPDLPIQDIYH